MISKEAVRAIDEALEAPRWWGIEQDSGVRGRFIGRCFCTESEIRKAVGPYHTITGNLVSVFAPPPK